jgi:predicted phage terminase large subunit-like protein
MAVTLNAHKLKEFIEIRIALSRRSFWEFCITIDPVFYRPHYNHLKILCDTLQSLHEGRIVRRGDEPWRFLDPEEPLAGLEVCRNLIINMPPRHGKTRTMVLFEAWLLGIRPKTKFITASYNDDAAADMSRYVRDTLKEERQTVSQIVYSMIFDTAIKRSDSSVSRWAVEGSYFSYIGTGPGGTVTGKGADYLIIDDPVKNAEIALNAPAMKKLTSWIMNTLLSRRESGSKMIVVHTRWPNGDATAAFMDSPEAHKFHLVVMKAKDEFGEMLCPDILSEDDYDSKKNLMDTTIFEANYNQKIVKPHGALYREFHTYVMLPPDIERKIMFCDTADQGADYLCALYGVVSGSYAYVTDVVYTQEGQEISLPMVGDAAILNDTKELCVESNSGGLAFSRDLDEYLLKRGVAVSIETPFETSNKDTRIITNAPAVCQRILFPLDWESKWPDYAFAMQQYLRIGKNLHDDAPDATTGFYLFAFDGGVILA